MKSQVTVLVDGVKHKYAAHVEVAHSIPGLSFNPVVYQGTLVPDPVEGMRFEQDIKGNWHGFGSNSNGQFNG